MIKRIYLIALIWIAALGSSLAATPSADITLSESLDVYDVGPQIKYYEDKSATITLNDAINLNQSSVFSKAKGESPSFSSTNSAYWFHFSVVNNSQDQKKWYARINYPLLDEIQFTTIRSKETSTINTGDSKAFNTRPVDHQYFIFPILFKPNESIDVYIKVVSSGAITLPLQLYQAEELFYTSNTHALLQGLHYGTLLILSIYNALLFFSTKSKSYLYNTLYMLSLGIFMFSISGLSFQYLWPNNPSLANTAIPVSEGFVILTIALFSRSFLYTSNEQNRTFQTTNIITVFGIAIILFGLFTPYHLAVKIGTMLGVLSIILVYATGIVRMAEGYKPAKSFVIAWTIFLTGALTYALATFGYISGQFIQEYIIRIATGAQVIFINVALATRVRVLNKQLIDNETEAKKTLENQVTERTFQLQQAMTELSLLNRTLKEKSTTDELTGIANRRFFNDTLDEYIKLAIREKIPTSLLLIDIDYFKKVNDQYGHLIGDACLKLTASAIEQCLNRPSDFLARYGGEEFAVVLPNTNAQGAEIIANQVLLSVRKLNYQAPNIDIKLTVSIGISTLLYPELNKTSLVRLADQALYSAKNNGRNTVNNGSHLILTV